MTCFLNRVPQAARCHIRNSLTHADLSLDPFLCLSLEVEPVKLVIIKVHSKADVIKSVCSDALKLFSDVNAAKAGLLDFGEPLAVLELYVLLYHTNHDA